MKQINNVVRNILKPIVKGYSPLNLNIRRNWNNIIGEKYCDYCELGNITFKKEAKSNAILYIICFNSVISFYIENNKLFVLEKINAIFGYSIIGEIRIKQNPKIIKQININKKSISAENFNKINQTSLNIENSELKEAIKNFGNALFLN